MSVSVTGVNEVLAHYRKYPKKLKSEMRKVMGVYGGKMVTQAKVDHRFTSRSGRGVGAIEAVVRKDGAELRFRINRRLVASGKYNYMVLQHEGTYKGYHPSGLVQPHKKVAPKTGYGIEHDYFMQRAWDKFIEPLTDAIADKMINAMSGF